MERLGVSEPNDILLPVNLKSLLRDSGLGRKDIISLRKNSSGIFTIHDMPIVEKTLTRTIPFGDAGYRGYSLGLTIGYDAYDSISQAFELAKWHWGFEKYALTYRSDYMTSRAKKLGFGTRDASRPVDNIVETTQQYLDLITKEGVPICFFVPTFLFSHEDSGVTRAEMEWFLKNPDRSNNTFFIFGLFECINKEWSINEDWDMQKIKLVNAFRKMRGNT